MDGGNNTYIYGLDNPVIFDDPYGKFVAGNHVEITIVALYSQGYSLQQVLDITARTAAVDALPGSQDPANAIMHAMRTPGETVAQAQKAYIDYIDKQLQSCTTEGLAKALHAAEDSAAAGHSDFQVWNGHVTFYHFWHDAVPTMDEFNTAVRRARALITQYKKECSCTK